MVEIGGAEIGVVVPAGPFPGAAEDQVGAVRPEIRAAGGRAGEGIARRVETEEVGAAAQDVVLAQAAEDDVAAGVALDVVLAVGRFLERRDDRQRADVVANEGAVHRAAAGRCPRGADVGRQAGVVGPARERGLDAAVALDDVVAHLAEQQVVRRAAREVVVAEAPGALRALGDGEAVELVGVAVVVVEGDSVLGPPRGAVRVAEVARGAVREEDPARVLAARDAAGGAIAAAVQERAAERLEAEAGDVLLGRDVRADVGAEQPPEQEDLVTEDEVVRLVTVDHVVAGAADEDVAVAVAEDRVVVAVLVGARLDRPDRRDERRLDLLEPAVRQVRVHDLLDDRAVVAEDHVVVPAAVRPEGARRHGDEAAPADRVSVTAEEVAARVQVVGHGGRDRLDRRAVVDEPDVVVVEGGPRARVDGLDRERAPEDVHVHAGVAVDVILTALPDDLVVT